MLTEYDSQIDCGIALGEKLTNANKMSCLKTIYSFSQTKWICEKPDNACVYYKDKHSLDAQDAHRDLSSSTGIWLFDNNPQFAILAKDFWILRMFEV